MVGREPIRVGVLGDLVDDNRPILLDDAPEDAAACWRRADQGYLFFGHSGVMELDEGPMLTEDTQGPILCARCADRFCNEAVEHTLEIQFPDDTRSGLDKRGQPIN